MDLLDTWHDDRPISGHDARHFRFLKKFKMADFCQFLCENLTLLLITHYSFDRILPNFHRCCHRTLYYLPEDCSSVTFILRSPGVMKGHEIWILLIDQFFLDRGFPKYHRWFISIMACFLDEFYLDRRSPGVIEGHVHSSKAIPQKLLDGFS